MTVYFKSTAFPYLNQTRHINVRVWSPFLRTYIQYPTTRPDQFVYEMVVRDGILRISNTTPRVLAEQERADEEERLRREAVERRVREEAERRAREEEDRRRERWEEERRREEEERRRAEEECRRIQAQQQQEDHFSNMMRYSRRNRPEDRGSSSQDHRHRREHIAGQNGSGRY